MKREELISRIEELVLNSGNKTGAEVVADFILADRAHICAPLIEVCKKDATGEWVKQEKLWEAIDTSLKLAGIEQEGK